MPNLPPQTPASLRFLSAEELSSTAELRALSALIGAGWEWAGVALPPAVEGEFYRLNNLPHQLRRLFQGLDEGDPDEDIVEEAEEGALALISGHYLLDEVIDDFYEAIAPLSTQLVIRRPGDPGGRRATHARGALLELKRLFQDDWRVDAVMARLLMTSSLALDARPVLVSAAVDRRDGEASRRASSVLGYQVEVWLTEDGSLTRALAL